ncbi:uncharacterized protein cubi_03736 [Cryptosporidium ubiquitum]|uniref:Uncharacterized protein n=1 Tax=Cryptosporidium ubiquitum TaxID=857276 RepID=A0A1J4MLY3_9CRYT|nr:uncharacterized protein cubi_03736 [Cryptosporidium ubiquitum]OII75257.1 hypothetical protein cubi_03736 [Cryptosporidium ubiquitum]
MKCFYVLPLNNNEVFSDLGIRILESIYESRCWEPKQISLSNIYEADLDSENFRQNVLNTIIRQISMFDPMRYEGICHIQDASYRGFSCLWRISEQLGVIFVMVIDKGSFSLRGKSILDFVVEWSEKFTQSGKELVANDILIVLHILAPAGQLQLLNDDILSKIELMVNRTIRSY